MDGKTVKHIRTKLGLTQTELARWLGLGGKSHVSRLEHRTEVRGPVARLLVLLWESGGDLYSERCDTDIKR